MKTDKKYVIVLTLVLLLMFVLNLSLGSVGISLKETLGILTGTGKATEAHEFILLHYRLPKAITAVLTGSGLAVAGLMMQTFFRNPLAGPFVLGISSGASLGVALFILGGSLFGLSVVSALGTWGTIIAASVGSFLVLGVVMVVAFRIQESMALLIIGLMFGSLTAAVVSILAYFSPAEDLQRYIFWSFGSLGDIPWSRLGILFSCWSLGIVLAFAGIKTLNALLLGEQYARTLGISLNRSRLIIIISTSLLAGSLTAFTGPIAFVGLAVPHLVRQVIHSSNHWLLLPCSMLGGAILMLLCDAIAQAPLQQFTLPINAITSLVGAPVVIWLLVRRKKLIF